MASESEFSEGDEYLSDEEAFVDSAEEMSEEEQGSEIFLSENEDTDMEDIPDDMTPQEELEFLSRKTEAPSRPKSSFQLFQDKINEQIQELEEENVAPKPWVLSGEVSSKKRPINSLLEEVVEFDQSIKVFCRLFYYLRILLFIYIV